MNTQNTAAATLLPVGEAIACAIELEQIGSVYGSECLSAVKEALVRSSDANWQSVIDAAVEKWERARCGESFITDALGPDRPCDSRMVETFA